MIGSPKVTISKDGCAYGIKAKLVIPFSTPFHLMDNIVHRFVRQVLD